MPPAAPDMPEGWWFSPDDGATFCTNKNRRSMPLSLLRALLATQGLRIIGPEEAAVLDVQKTVMVMYRARAKALATQEPSPEWDAFDAARVQHYNACAVELAIRGDEE